MCDGAFPVNLELDAGAAVGAGPAQPAGDVISACTTRNKLDLGAQSRDAGL